MGHVNVFLRAWNEHRIVTMGGRGACDEGGVWINTAHRNGQTGMKLKAEVVGPGLRSADRKRRGGDQRQAIFTIELPEPDEAVRVQIVEHGHAMKELAAVGASLCLLKGIIEAQEHPSHSAQCRRFGIETLLELEEQIGQNVPSVVLPGGITLAHALACVEMIRQIKAGEPRN